MIEQLIESLQQSTDLYTWVWAGYLGALLLLVVGLTYAEKYRGTDNEHIFGQMMIVLGAVVLICSVSFALTGLVEQSNLKKEIDDTYMTNIQSMSCSEIRTDLVNILESKNKEKPKTIYDYVNINYDWEKEYYFTKCETPLRDGIDNIASIISSGNLTSTGNLTSIVSSKVSDPVVCNAFTSKSKSSECVGMIVENKTEFKSDYTGYGKQYEDWK